MPKTYADFMNEITADELYDRLIEYGLFSEKLPPIFDVSSFLDFCKLPERKVFTDKRYLYISYNSMRNINIPRPIGIPTPMAHEKLCACLSDNWDKLQKHFMNTTINQKHIVSRIHVRKMYKKDALFEMNYKNWYYDGTPEPDIFIGKRFMVCADISKCYQSIYTHVIPWALVGKQVSKQNTKNTKEWYNLIDHFTQNTKNGETHGILIGPHTSNILSEIILCKIDKELCKHWDYVRNIDDFCCYVKSREDADNFLIDLNRCLNEYGLSLNHKKTEIYELPVGIVKRWVRQLKNKSLYFGKFKPYVEYPEVQEFLDYCIELISKNKENVSILLYALKILNKNNLTYNSQIYLIKTMVALSLIYPYIVPMLGKYLFDIYNTSTSIIENAINLIYEKYLPKRYYEAAAYALYYASKYNLKITTFNIDEIINANDCILSLTSLIYCRKQNDQNSLKKLKKYAKTLKENLELEEHWAFVYECLSVGLLAEDWKKMKQAKVSFLKKEFQ